MHARTLAEARAKVKPEPVLFKSHSRKKFTKDGKYFFRTLSSRYNAKSEVLALTGIPYKTTKSGEIVEYERITLCVSTAYCNEDGNIPITDLFQSLDLEPDAEVVDTFFEGKLVTVDISINEYYDADGNLINVFYNADSFSKAQ